MLEIFGPASSRRKTSLLSHRQSKEKGEKSADVEDDVRCVRDDAVSLGQECVRLAKHRAVPLDQLPICAEQVWFPPRPKLTKQKESVKGDQIHSESGRKGCPNDRSVRRNATPTGTVLIAVSHTFRWNGI